MNVNFTNYCPTTMYPTVSDRLAQRGAIDKLLLEILTMSWDNMFHVRSSKFRHIFGCPAKRELCYDGIKITKNAHDSNFCEVNPKFLAIVTECAGGGVFLVLQLRQTGRLSSNASKVCGHSAPVTDIKWNPFDDNIIASCSDDTTIKIWRIPDGGLLINLTEWIVDLRGHTKKVGHIEWHPTAENILLSSGLDFKCFLWNTETGECIQTISCHKDTIFSMSWNRDGSLFVTTCKDKKIRVIDPRQNIVVAQGEGHLGAKCSKVVFVGKDRVFTTGFSRMSERQYALWNTEDFSKPLRSESIDASSGIVIPYYDYDTKIMFLAGKGDGNIRYYEIVDDAPYVHYLNQYQSGLPQRGLGQMPKRGLDIKKCEIVRFYKLHTLKDTCEPLSMIVPRKSEIFQDDIFPPTASAVKSMTADEWISGMNKDPILVSLKDEFANSSLKSIKREREPITTEMPAVKRSSTTTGPTPVPAGATLERLPASIRNIYRLSGADEQILKYKNPVSERINAFESKANVSLTSLTELHSGGFDSDAAKTKLTSGFATSAEIIQNKENLHESELRKAFQCQQEEIQNLKMQLALKEKRIHVLEEEVRTLKVLALEDASKNFS